MKTRLLIVLCLMAVSFGSTVARANYAMDEQRQPDPAFTKFFLNRIDTWLRGHVFDYVPQLSQAEKKFVSDYLADPRSLGQVKGTGFIRSYSYSYSARDGKLTYGPFRFVRPTPTLADEQSFARVLKAEGLPSEIKDVIGLGFTGHAGEIEVIQSATELPRELKRDSKTALPSSQGLVTVTLYRAGKLVSVTAIERGVKAGFVCPAAPASAQADRVIDAQGEHYAFHPSNFEDEALSMEGRTLVHKIEQGLQLQPGVIDYHSQMDYRLDYP